MYAFQVCMPFNILQQLLWVKSSYSKNVIYISVGFFLSSSFDMEDLLESFPVCDASGVFVVHEIPHQVLQGISFRTAAERQRLKE